MGQKGRPLHLKIKKNFYFKFWYHSFRLGTNPFSKERNYKVQKSSKFSF